MSETIDYARLVLDESGAVAHSRDMMTEMLVQTVAGMSADDGEVQRWTRHIAPAVEKTVDFIQGAYERMIAGYYTKDELVQVLDLYRTPLGRKLLDQHSATKDQQMQFGTEWGRLVWEEMLRTYELENSTEPQ